MISTKNLFQLPQLDVLKKLTQSMAMLDAIIQRELEGRYYSFDARWDKGEQMASMRNGEGDSWFLVFIEAGAFLKGFDHESKMSPWNNERLEVWPGVLGYVPDVFKPFLKEPAFSMEDTTFCVWQLRGDLQWSRGDIRFPDGEDPDGSAWMLAILDGNPATYWRWAEEYYQRSVSRSAVEHIYSHKNLTDEIVNSLNPETSLADLVEDIAEIAYPG